MNPAFQQIIQYLQRFEQVPAGFSRTQYLGDTRKICSRSVIKNKRMLFLGYDTAANAFILIHSTKSKCVICDNDLYTQLAYEPFGRAALNAQMCWKCYGSHNIVYSNLVGVPQGYHAPSTFYHTKSQRLIIVQNCPFTSGYLIVTEVQIARNIDESTEMMRRRYITAHRAVWQCEVLPRELRLYICILMFGRRPRNGD